CATCTISNDALGWQSHSSIRRPALPDVGAYACRTHALPPSSVTSVMAAVAEAAAAISTYSAPGWLVCVIVSGLDDDGVAQPAVSTVQSPPGCGASARAHVRSSSEISTGPVMPASATIRPVVRSSAGSTPALVGSSTIRADSGW